MIEVELPDGRIAEFPDGTPRDTMQTALREFSAREWPNLSKDTGFTAFKNTADIAGAGVGKVVAGGAELFSRAMGPPIPFGQKLYEDFWGGKDKTPKTPTEAIRRFIPVDPGERAARLGVPETPLRSALARGTEFLTAAMLPLPKVSTSARVAGLAGTGGAIGQYAGGDEGALAMGLALPLLAARAAAPKVAPAPTRAEFDRLARETYRVADDAGTVIPRAEFARFVESLEPKLVARTFDKDFHPLAFKSYQKMAAEAERGNITLKSVETLRGWMNEAKANAKPRDAGIIKIMRESLDDFVVGRAGAPDYRKAAGFYRRARGLERIEKLVERAKDSASTYTAAGYDTALRNQFKAFVKSKDMRFYTPAEQAAFKRVARGDPIGNVMRQLGRLAPQNILHQLLLANINPKMMALAVPGAAARFAASKSTQRNIKLAQDLLARGYPVPPNLRRYLDVSPAGAGVFLGQGSQPTQ